jgi:hypothetical protein
LTEEPPKHKRRYLAYLLRLWQESGGELPQWRASLESSQSGDRLGFASLTELSAFLEAKTSSSAEALDRPHEDESHLRSLLD